MSAAVETPTAPDGITLKRIEDLAARLGISKAHAWELVRRDPRAPRRIKLGSSTRFRSDDIDRYIESLTGEATARAAVGAGNK